jgi:hypothetical protein
MVINDGDGQDRFGEMVCWYVLQLQYAAHETSESWRAPDPLMRLLAKVLFPLCSGCSHLCFEQLSLKPCYKSALLYCLTCNCRLKEEQIVHGLRWLI